MVTTEQPVIRFRNVTKRFGNTDIIYGLDLAIQRGEFLTLLGPSGCGKTTILRLIAGFESVTSGEILLNDQDISQHPPAQRPVNTVFQSYALFPHLSVFDNVAFGLRACAVPANSIDSRVMEALTMVKMADFAQRRPHQLSGGQQQRVAIARAVVNRPQVLLLDESLSALDYKLRKTMQLELKQLQRQLGITFVFVTHDQEEALSMSDRIAVMNQGRIAQIGRPRDLYETPNNLFIARFIGEINVLPARIEAIHDNKYCTFDILGKSMDLQVEIPVQLHQWVNVLLRPEDLRIWRLGEGTEEERAALFPGKVEEVIYKGSTVDMYIRLEKGLQLATTQFFNEDDPACIDLDFVPGERVYVDWVKDWEVILADDEL